MEKQTTIIEVNGVRLEVDLRSAKRIDELKVGSRVKCLMKDGYSGTEFKTRPGVVVGFEPFKARPTIVVAYVETDWISADLKFRSFNEDTKDFEIVADLDHNALELDKQTVLDKFDRDIAKKEADLQEVRDKRAFFERTFSRYFTQTETAEEAQ